ncbi:MAG: RNA-binding domain-containing protein [Candidatus Jordarchaeales archaeon]|nr:hypothetical protein [Candidatus Jordarchaeia archaeon]
MGDEELSSVEFEAFVHSTEDPEKVLKALLFLLDNKGEVKREKVRGHYGNEVIIYRVKLSGKGAKEVVDRLASLMREEDRKRLGGQLDLRHNGHGNLYLRFDKQKAYLGEVHLSDYEDVVKVKVKFSFRELEEIREACRRHNLIVD